MAFLFFIKLCRSELWQKDVSKWAVKGNINKFRYKISVCGKNWKAKEKGSKEVTSEGKENYIEKKVFGLDAWVWGIHWPDFSIDGWCPGLPGEAKLGTIWLSHTDLWDEVRLAWGAF